MDDELFEPEPDPLPEDAELDDPVPETVITCPIRKKLILIIFVFKAFNVATDMLCFFAIPEKVSPL